MTATGSLVEVHLLQLPVTLAVKAQQHFEEMMREFTLVATGAHSPHPDHHLPTRLMQLVDGLVERFANTTDDADRRLAAAIERGDQTIDDHVIEIPAEAGPASQALGDMIDEADEYCRRGEHLLTLATPADCVAYRRWYLAEIIEQIAGHAPKPWPDSEQARALA